MLDEERLDDVWRSIEGYRGAKKVVITKPDVLVDDIEWMIKIINEQQRELKGWRKEFMGI
jgi:hypothetical protein